MKEIEIYDLYLLEIKKTNFYRSKYSSYEKSDRRYEQYRQKFLNHRRKAIHYYFQLKETISYSDLFQVENMLKATGFTEESSSYEEF